MPRFPLPPQILRTAAVMLAASGIMTGVAQSAAAATTAPAPNPLTIPVANPGPTALSSSTSSGSTSLLWNGDMSTGTFSQYPYLWACPAGVTMDPYTSFLGHQSAKFTVTDTSNSTYCPGNVFTHNPAASLLTPAMFGNGDDRYISFGTMFPVGFPKITNWFQFGEIFGPPYGGSPTMGFDVRGNSLGLWRDGTHHYDNPWHAPITYGSWEYLTLHVKFSTNPSIGFVEIWLNGVQQHFIDGSTRLHYTTLLPGDNWNGYSRNVLYLDQYRGAAPLLGSRSIYHADTKVGTTLASVTP
jgi:hypothetical protein